MVGKRWIKSEGKGKKRGEKDMEERKKWKEEIRRKKSENNIDTKYQQYTERITTHRVLSKNSMFSMSYGHINMKVKKAMMGHISY